jgi:hypothetical protein
MNSVKCPQCGLVYWSTAENCRRCGLLTGDIPTVQPESYVQQAPTPTSGRHSQISDADAERLLRNLKKDSRLFYFIGGLQILAWFFIGQLLIVDAFFNIGLSYVTNRFRSRIAASLLLLLTLLSVMIGLLGMAMGGISFNLFIPLILLWRLGCSIRMVYTTFKLNAYEEVDVTRMMPPLPPVFHEEEDASQWGQPAGSPQWQPE